MDDVDQQVGARIRLHRRLKDLSQKQLANEIRVSVQQLQRYEKGTARVTAARLHLLAKQLEVAPATFFAGCLIEGRELDRELVMDSGLSDECKELNDAFQRISSERTRRSVIDLLESVAALGVADAES